jgi:hypothetical protein
MAASATYPADEAPDAARHGQGQSISRPSAASRPQSRLEAAACAQLVTQPEQREVLLLASSITSKSSPSACSESPRNRRIDEVAVQAEASTERCGARRSRGHADDIAGSTRADE